MQPWIIPYFVIAIVDFEWRGDGAERSVGGGGEPLTRQPWLLTYFFITNVDFALRRDGAGGSGGAASPPEQSCFFKISVCN